MTHPDAESLVQSFALTHRIIRMQTDGLTHADSLLQLPFRGNCLNWVLGHIVAGRNTALKLLREPPVWDKEDAVRYNTGSEPIGMDEQALPLDRLLDDLDRSQQRIVASLEQMPAEGLSVPVDSGRGEQPLGQTLAGLHWHETYHTGQLELLRQLAGKNDALI